jgi:cytochrome P450
MVSLQRTVRLLFREILVSVTYRELLRCTDAIQVYAQHGSTCISSVTLSGSIPTLWLADAQTIKTIVFEPANFPKDIVAVRANLFCGCKFIHGIHERQYETLDIYGKNMVSTEGADWKRHRKVANPAFNEVFMVLPQYIFR